MKGVVFLYSFIVLTRKGPSEFLDRTSEPGGSNGRPISRERPSIPAVLHNRLTVLPDEIHRTLHLPGKLNVVLWL